MTTARVIPFFPHAVGRRPAGERHEPESPFRHLMEREWLTTRQVRHRREILKYARRADVPAYAKATAGKKVGP